MTSFRIIDRKNGYSIKEPLDSLRDNHIGFVMVCNPKGEVLKFFTADKLSNARNYFDYVCLSKWSKLKYWLNYKRG